MDKYITALNQAPKRCMACGAITAKPEYWRLDYRNMKYWPHNFLTKRGYNCWIVRCTECSAIHIWSWPNVYKVYVDEPNVRLGES